MSGYTKGPWEIIKCQHGRTIYSIGPLSSDEYAGASWLEVSDTDARLIAAAPDLLEALEVALTSMLDSGYNTESAVIRKTVMAIAKARGEK